MTYTISWEDRVNAKVAERDAKLPTEWSIPATDKLNVLEVPKSCGLLSAEELEITETSAEHLLAELVSGKRTSYDVTLAFCKRATIAQHLTNCLSEVFFEEGLATAKAIDEEFKRTGKPIGPLHGLPVSIKDCFNIENYDSTIGFVAFIGQPATKETESEMTKIMRECGAVMFCKTNIPTAMMMCESYNNIFGYTTNPFNRSLTSGGSSGGESSLLALKGAPLGIGTDIGGSVRIPAGFCGMYGLKPSFGRFATYGAKAGLAGQEAIKSTNGPMSTTLEALEIWSKAVVGTKPWTKDPHMIPIPWRDVEVPEKLCFGIVMDNGVIAPTPPVRRALLQTKAALEAAGHKVIEFTPYDGAYCFSLKDGLFAGDGGARIASLLVETGEPWPRGMKLFQRAHEKSKLQVPTAAALWARQADRTVYAKKCVDAWESTVEVTGTGRPIDGLISPMAPVVAGPHYSFENVSYTLWQNILDLPSCTFPVTMVSQELDVKEALPYEPRNNDEKITWENYDPAAVAGAPVALQLNCRRLEEELVLKLVKVARDSLNA